MRFIIIIVFVLFSYNLYPQDHSPATVRQENGLIAIFQESSIHGHIRNFFMATINREDLTSYYTNATGGAIGFTTGNFKGFEAGVKGIFTFKTFGSDLGLEDPITGANAKWEYELYDVLNQGNFKDLDRLEELYIRYRFGKSYISYGKLESGYTPLLNHSDGRMKPFAHRGFWGYFNLNMQHNVNLGWLDGVSPRSTTEWFDLEEGLGLFFNGFQPNGERANYHGFYPVNGIGIFNYNYQIKNFNLAIYDIFIDKLHNTIWTEANYVYNGFNLGLQYVYQTPMNFSEGMAYENRYIQPDENGLVLSSQLGWGNNRFNFAFAYTHAFDTGRFLFPKELGRDRFFTSIPRSRLEGLGAANVYTLKGEFLLPRPALHFGVELQQVKGTTPGDFQFNKYNMDESFQVNTHLTYAFNGFLNGLNFDLLWVYRENQNTRDAESIFNKSNFNQLNFVTNFNF
ncbi:hypothetical protein FHG64_03270 [Antarcticibacterium flavum]|uniref:Outer membrane porin, OprD family n=1 Tax=Antarcticibacterium flavum TaxID=2058175 RepID=A0A5B7WZ84_9FLAO|nr:MULTISPECIES: hypothetical protein [Antarcticibacterium]MCM4158631.1 hypothetical protein [Antarcticibacterium sp. W02-3]QCY68486.1 hypothetical protein FHG64_03270 [Antarcticibacterium flavum]